MRFRGRYLVMAAAVALASCSSGTAPDAAVTDDAVTSDPVTSDPVTTVAATTVPATSTAPSTTAAPARPRTIDELLALGRPIVLAHTAGEDEFPASTLFAFGESAAAGVDMLDLNVGLTADGDLVVQHDDTVDRNTDGTGKVAELTAAQIGALDGAYWFTAACADCHDRAAEDYLYRGIRTGDVPPPEGYSADDFAIPTLRQVAERFPGLPLNVEIKGEGDVARRAAEVLATQLEELGRTDSTVVASFDDDIVAYFHQLAPEIEVSAGLDALTAYVLSDAPVPDGMRILQLPPVYSGIEVITPELVARATADGFPIWIWPNDRDLENIASYRSYLADGIAGLNINFPTAGVAALAEWTAAAAVPAAASAGCTATAVPAGETTESLEAAGLAGTFIRHLPPGYDGTSPLPVLLGLHGWSQPAALLGIQGDLAAAADRDGFVVVLPDITRPVPLWDTALDGADVAWMSALLDELAATLCIDTNRIDVAGMSNGAMMASTLACTESERVAAVATVAGLRLPESCTPTRHVPIVAFHGTSDGYLAFEGGFGEQVASLPTPDGTGTLGDVAASGADALSVSERAAGWAAANGCTVEAAAAVADDVDLVSAAGCDAPVELYVVDGGGHSWPGSAFDQGIADLVGATTTSIDATAVMLDFFGAHPLAP